MLAFRIYQNDEADPDALESGAVYDPYSLFEPDDAAPVRRPWWKRWARKLTLGGIAATITGLLVIGNGLPALIAFFYAPSALRFERVFVIGEDEFALQFSIENRRDRRYGVNGIAIQTTDPVKQWVPWVKSGTATADPIGEWLTFGRPTIIAESSASKGNHVITMRINHIFGSPKFYAAGGKDEFFRLYGSKTIRFVAQGLDNKSGDYKRIAECVVPLSEIHSFVVNKVSPEDAIE